MAFDDLFSEGDFVLDPEDIREVSTTETWDTGNSPDIFASGENPDIFSTND
jgi:hypothetical protein